MKNKIIALVALSCILVGAILIYVNVNAQKGKIPVLMYHHLEEGTNTTGIISPDHFEEQIKTLTEKGYTGITMQELYEYLDGEGELPKKPIVITFDDGYLSNYEMAYPILKKYKMKATMFVICSRVFEEDEENLYPDEIPKMNWAQLREMKDYVSIQSHTYDSHKKIEAEDETMNGAIFGPGYIDDKLESKEEYEARVSEDLYLSRKLIEEKLGYEAIAIAYPYGNYSENTIKIAQEVGFKMAFKIGEKSVTKGDDFFTLNRITADGNYTGKELIKVIKKSETQEK